jgi:hypothetical protein
LFPDLLSNLSNPMGIFDAAQPDTMKWTFLWVYF